MARLVFCRLRYRFALLALAIAALFPAGGRAQTFDLMDNDVKLDKTPGKDFAYYYAAVRRGYNGGDWRGEGTQTVLAITSSMAANDPAVATSVDIVDNSILGLTSFGGHPVDANNILIKYTYYGDIDINGQVDADDLTVFGNNFGRLSGATQIDGDTDFDNDVDADDLTVFGNGFGKGIGNPLSVAAPAAVPEPAAIALALVALAIAAVMCSATRLRRA